MSVHRRDLRKEQQIRRPRASSSCRLASSNWIRWATDPLPIAEKRSPRERGMTPLVHLIGR